MGIYIKGMEMPKDGEWVNVNICSDGSVYFIKSASNGFVFYGVRKGEAIEIPSHGRLIDADDLLAMVKRAMEDDDMYEDDYRDVRDWLAVAPTIIEAEGGDAPMRSGFGGNDCTPSYMLSSPGDGANSEAEGEER